MQNLVLKNGIFYFFHRIMLSTNTTAHKKGKVKKARVFPAQLNRRCKYSA